MSVPNENILTIISNEVEDLIMFIWNTSWLIINQLLSGLVNLLKIILVFLYKKITMKIKSLRLPKFEKKDAIKDKDYSQIYTIDIPNYLYRADNFNINLEAIETICNQTLQAYNNTVEGIKNRTYAIFDNLYFLNKIASLSNIDNLTQVESVAQKFRNIQELQTMAKLILSTITKRRMSNGNQYTQVQLDTLHSTLDSLHTVDNTIPLSQRNKSKMTNISTQNNKHSSKKQSLIIYIIIALITILVMIFWKWS